MNLVQITLPDATPRSRWTLHRGSVGAYALAVVLSGFYVCVFWFPDVLQPLTQFLDPLSYALRRAPSDQWFLYGTLYTSAILIMGVRMLHRYRHERYHVYRTSALMAVQLLFAYLLPATFERMGHQAFYLTYFWPLKPEYLFPGSIDTLLLSSDRLYVFVGWWSIVCAFIATPVLTYYFGKRWYCSWVCGCGALAETAGDPFRHLSNKSAGAWKLERWMIYSVLVCIIAVTGLLWWANAVPASPLAHVAYQANRWYGFFIGAVFSGVIGVGFYPLLGSRIWCRFGCPMAAVLGILQKYASRFRITVQKDQCISCGNCSTNCEMGIDVQQYAERGETFTRASCVGCGVCSSVCPRGVLRLDQR